MLPGLSAATMLAGGLRAPAFRNLATLFNGGAVDGIMIDFTDPTTLFQDVNGAAAVVNNGDPIGLALDQHKWGGKTLAEYRAAQAELLTNPEFTSDVSGWNISVTGVGNISWVSGKLRLTASSGGPYFYQSFSTVVGRWYEATIVFDSRVGTGNQALYIGTAAGSGANLSGANTFTTPGTYRRWFRASATTTFISVQSASTTTSSDWESVSIKEIDGNHATQSSSSARPTWANASNDVLFDGSNDYLSVVDFDFPSGDCALAAWAKSNTATRAIVGANSSTTSYMILVHNSSNLPVMQVGGSGTVYAGTTAINGVYHTLVIDKNTAEANLLVDGVVEATKTTPGSTAVTRDLAIGAQNANGTLGAYMAGNIKRVFAIHARIRDTMTAADFHANLIAA